ncbi:MAG: hypothetical protein Fur003_6120 [Candidatus Dojkabacteria bacterium]
MEEIYIATALAHSNIGSVKARRGSWDQKDMALQELLHQERIQMVGYWRTQYPEKLKHLTDYPALLFYKGNFALLNQKIICIVGTRKMSEYGQRVIEMLLDFDGKSIPLSIISGLAYGVDAAVHQQCLKRNISTIGVVAGSIDKGFPEINRRLYEQMTVKGLVLSEFPPGRALFRGMFPMRNRILAALADIVVVVEAPIGSGALITARHALELGRDVFVVPGSVFDPNLAGAHELLKQGAQLITNQGELFEAIDLQINDVKQQQILNYFDKIKGGESLIKLLKQQGFITIDNLIERALLNEREARLMLTNLELEGILWRAENNRYYVNQVGN